MSDDVKWESGRDAPEGIWGSGEVDMLCWVKETKLDANVALLTLASLVYRAHL